MRAVLIRGGKVIGAAGEIGFKAASLPKRGVQILATG